MSYVVKELAAARLCYIAMLLSMVLLSGCEKEEPPPEYFEQHLIGTWCVREFFTSDGITIIHETENSVTYYRSCSSKIYSMDNPAFCNLDHIWNIQIWNIVPGQDWLQLHIEDFCGTEQILHICCSNLEYVDLKNSPGMKEEGISAQIQLYEDYNNLIFNSFILYPQSNEIWATRSGENGLDYMLHLCKVAGI